MRLLSKDPSERPDSAQDVFNALDAIDLTARGETVEREGTSLDSLAGGVFVGRRAEMDQLKAALEDVLGGRGRLITLMGEPGIGKTRTSEEFATYAGLRGAQVLWGRCYEGGGAPPYWPWVQAIRSYVRLTDAEVLRRELGAGAAVVGEVVSDIRERLPGIGDPPEANDAESARFRLFDSITAFLKTASQSQPMVVVLDDLHWSDAPSLLLLEFVARELSGSRLLILATYRDMELNRRHPLSQTLGELTRERLFERVLLRGLTSDDIARFMELASGIEPPSALVDAVFTQTEGNPLFVTEVTRLLVQGGDLTAESAASRSSWTVRIPEGVREVIGRRLDRLSERCNDALAIAAVIGRQFELDHLRELVEDISEDRLLEVLEEALGARVIEELPDQIGRYQFSHALIQETLIDEISITRRVRMNARIGETLERLYGESADAHADELVIHFDRAQTLTGPEKVIHYSLVAGERSLAAHGTEEAVTHFERALAAWGGPDQELDETGARIFSGLGRAQGVAFEPRRVPAAMGHLARAFDYFADHGMIAEAVGAASYRLHPKPGALRGTEPMLRRALEIVEPGSLDEARLQCRLGWVLGRETGDLEGSLEVLDLASATARSAGDVNTEAMAEAYRGAALWANLKYRECLDASQRAVALATQVDNIKTRLTALNSLAIARLGLGETDGENTDAEQALELAERSHDRTEQADSLWINAHVALMKGDFKTAREFNERGLERNSEGGRLLIQSLILLAETGDLEGALKVVEVTERVHQEAWSGTEGTTASILAYSAATLARVSDEPSLVDIAQRSAGVALKSPGLLPVFTEQARVSLALVAVVKGDAEEADRMYREVEGTPGIIAPVHFLSTDHILGLLATTAGRFDLAERHMTDTRAFYEPRGYGPSLAWLLSDYAEMLLKRAEGASSASARDVTGDREKAAELQDEALAITRELGMRPLTERILARREILRA